MLLWLLVPPQVSSLRASILFKCLGRVRSTSSLVFNWHERPHWEHFEFRKFSFIWGFVCPFCIVFSLLHSASFSLLLGCAIIAALFASQTWRGMLFREPPEILAAASASASVPGSTDFVLRSAVPHETQFNSVPVTHALLFGSHSKRGDSSLLSAVFWWGANFQLNQKLAVITLANSMRVLFSNPSWG